MKFNTQLKTELDRYEKKLATESITKTAPIREAYWKPQPPKILDRPSEKVVGGTILWKPIDRAAAMLLAKSPWWAQPPVDMPTDKIEAEPKRKKRKRKRNHMKGVTEVSGGTIFQENVPANCEYLSKSGLNIRMVNGESFVRVDEVDALICEQISKLPAETRPNVLAAQDARKIVRELLDGIGGEMEKFNASSKKYLEDIRQTRFAVVSETASMTKELKDVRQFFLGNDYHDQITRLREFVDLCERLHKLKQSGFLDSVADTMLRLADRQAVSQ